VASKLSLLLFLSASKCIQNIRCPAPDIHFSIRALTSLNISSNNIGKLSRGKLIAKPSWWKYGEYGKDDDHYEPGPPEGAIAIANAIKTTNGALVKFDISSNALCAAGSKALAVALTGNQNMTELNIASNFMGTVNGGTADMSGIIAITDAIPTMGALVKLNMSNNGMLTKEAGRAIGDMLKTNGTLKELDVSYSWWRMNESDKDGPGFAQGLADGLCTNGKLVKLVLSKYDFSATDALGDMLAVNTVLKYTVERSLAPPTRGRRT
jgi:hypothetical protein